MEGTRDTKTRSHSALGDYDPLNNQKRPEIGEYVRVNVVADKGKYDNVHTHQTFGILTNVRINSEADLEVGG